MVLPGLVSVKANSALSLVLFGASVALLRLDPRFARFAPALSGIAALVGPPKNLQIAIEESGAEVTHDGLPVVEADRMQLTQLFQNLIENAIKFRGKVPPRVRISATPEGKEWHFSVADNGIGIAPEFRDRIFLIFQRLHNRDRYPGTGFGLAVCKKVVERPAEGGSQFVVRHAHGQADDPTQGDSAHAI